MATAQAQLTPTANTSPATVSVPTRELSGAQWVARFPGSNQVSDCAAPFAANLQSFISAMQAGGATVTVSATYRPPERAYLMHWAYMIVNEDQDPRTVPAMAGVNIKWDHTAADGTYSSTASVNAAQAMVNGYGMQSLNTPPALSSRHTMRFAVDMSISWAGDLTINKADGTYSVIKYVGGNADKPHWSDTGH
jgi:hypothetical protein